MARLLLILLCCLGCGSLLSGNEAPTLSGLATDIIIDQNGSSGTLNFSVDDAEGAVATLSVSAATSNAGKIPVSGCVFGGGGANRTLIITPTPGQSGTVTITVTVSDTGGATSTPHAIAVTINAPPTITGLAPSVTIDRDGNSGPIAFSVDDDYTVRSGIDVTATSGDTSKILDAGCVISANAGNRTLVITPIAGQSGSVTVTVTAKDARNQITQQTIAVTINAPPTFTGLAATVTIDRNGDSGPLAFTVNDDATAAASIVVTAASGDTSKILNSGCVITAGTGGSRTLVITPITGQSGSVTVTVTAKDGRNQITQQTIAVTINAPPTFTGLTTAVTIDRDGNSGSLAFTVADDATAAASIVVAATSGDTSKILDSGCVITAGSGGNRTLVITPIAGQTGSVTVTVTAKDARNQITQQTIAVTINGPPTISGLTAALTIDRDGNSGPLTFTVADDATTAASIVVTAASGDTSRILDSGCVITAGSGGNRTLVITPIAGQTGSVTVTVTAKDARNQITQQTIAVTINGPPTISGLTAAVTIDRDGNSGPLTFTVADDATTAASIVVTAASGDTSRILDAGCVITAGSGGSRTLVITPIAGQTGSVTVTVTAKDERNQITQQTIAVTINGPPTISGLPAAVTIDRDGNSGPLTFTVADDATAGASIVVTAASGDTSKILDAGCVITAGTGGNRTLVISPITGQSGSATVIVSAKDARNQITQHAITVTINAPPTITGLVATVTIDRNSNSGPLTFTVDDDATAAASIVVTAASGDTSRILDAGCVITGAAGNRTLVITPITGQSGSVTVTVTAKDARNQITQHAIAVTINAPPTFSGLVSAVTCNRDGSSAPLAFTVADDATAAASIVVTATSGNTAKLLDSGCVITAGTGGNRTLVITPIAGQGGAVTVTVTAMDARNQATQGTIAVTINIPPTFTGPSPPLLLYRETRLDTTVALTDDLSGNVGLTVTTQQATRIPQANCALVSASLNIASPGGSNSTGLALTPAAGITGSAGILLRATDALGLFTELTVPCQIDGPPACNPAAGSVPYNLNLAGYQQLISGAVAIQYPLGTEHSLHTGGGNGLTITAQIRGTGGAVRYSYEDFLSARNTSACIVETNSGSGVQTIKYRTDSSKTLALASFDQSTWTLTMLLQPDAETVALSGSPAIGRAAVLQWLLQTIAYNNQAAQFATLSTSSERTVHTTLTEPGRSVASDPFVATVSLQLSNLPPDGTRFAAAAVTPRGRTLITLQENSGQVVACDDHTPNDSLSFSVVTGFANGQLVEVSGATATPIAGFTGNKLNAPALSRPSVIAYVNSNPNVSSDQCVLAVTDAGGLVYNATIVVSIGYGSGRTLIVSDPLTAIVGTSGVAVPVIVAGPGGQPVTVTATDLPGFAPVGSAVTPPTGLSTDQTTGLVTGSLAITPPASGDYLAFLLTCTIGLDSTSQPFIIRLLPAAPAAPAMVPHASN